MKSLRCPTSTSSGKGGVGVFEHIGLAGFIMMSERADTIEPNFGKMFKSEPLRDRGYIEVPTTPGFGLELNGDEVNLIHPYDRSSI